MPNEEDLRLAAVIAAALERALRPFVDATTELSARTAGVESRLTRVESRLTVLAQVTESGFHSVVGRLDSLEVKTETIEERLGRFVASVTRGRTSDTDRMAALEKRVAELESQLQRPRQ